jgi:hypothetical protein
MVRKSVVSAQAPSSLQSARQWVPRARRFAARRPIFYRQTGLSQFHLGVLLDISESGLLRVEETQWAVGFPWLCPPFPVSCAFRFTMVH